MSYSIYQCSIRRKSCISALISKIPLSDTEMDYMIVKSSDLGVHCIDIFGTNVLKYHSGALQVMFEDLTSRFPFG